MGETEGPEDSQSFSEAVEVEGAPDNVRSVVGGVKHTLFLTSDGTMFTVGSNECCQLGRNPMQDESFEIAQVDLPGKVNIIQIAAGQFHNAAVADDGRLFMWGANHMNQCGVDNAVKIPKPKRISSLTSVVQVACGENSTIVLLESCSVFIFGQVNDEPILPEEVDYLAMLPIVQVAAGNTHFAALTASGQVFTWGQNTNGQCTGVISETWIEHPMVVNGLSKVVFIDCGAKHTVVLTTEGRMFSFGTNLQGQLGDDRREDAVNLPKAITELLGTSVSSIACGSRYTCAIANGKAYAFGLNNTGQLGIGTFKNCGSPTLVRGIVNVSAVFPGYEHTFFLIDDIADLPTNAVPVQDLLKSPNFLTLRSVQRLFQNRDKIELVGQIESVFSSVGCLNGSFLYDDDRRFMLISDEDGVECESCNGLNLDDVMHAMNLLNESTSARQYSEIIMTSLNSCEVLDMKLLLKTTSRKKLNFEMLRIFMLLIWIPPMVDLNDKIVNDFVHRYTNLLVNISEETNKLFENWWSSLPTRHFNRFTLTIMKLLEHLFQKNYEKTNVLRPLLNLIHRMAAVNKIKGKIPYDHFYLNKLEEFVSVKKDYLQYWLYHHPDLVADNVTVPKGPDPFFWFNYPCLLNTNAKSDILTTHSKILMHTSIQNAAERDIMHSILMGQLHYNPYLHFTIRRNNIVHDTITELLNVAEQDLTKPLRVNFRNEEAEDEGGVRKEYFMLLFRELLQPTYGMFNEDEESHLIWFSGFPVEDHGFAMVGSLCAMAIYNCILVELPFPLALYKYLCGVAFTLEDLAELHPQEARSIEHLLDYEGDDVEDVFCLTFSMSITIFGHTEDVELKTDGHNRPVTNENRKEFAELYIKRRMELGHDGSIERQLAQFKRGFMRLLNNDILCLFQPRELMEMTAGNENYNWDELKANCRYKEPYDAEHPSIKCFWEAFFELDAEEKKKFLLFLMGTTRIPWKGMSAVDMVIQPTDAEKLPVAHTCFNLLDLPSITDKTELLRRLRICIDNNQGFTLV
uniref:HECT domain-containing protein n=1 Tax=Panagrellus redivivus TaxID=6233 RepID=A0A7E4VH12_PANRE